MAPSGRKRGRKGSAAAADEDEIANAPDPPTGRDSNKRPKATELNTSTGSGTAVETSSRPVIVFAHGAGANSKHEWMVRWKKLLAATTNAVEVITFDYPYLQGTQRRAAPKAEKLIEPHMEEVEKAAKKHPGHPIVLVGKSMGSRVGCMVAGYKGTDIVAVVCLGYPLKGMNGAIRDQTLLELQVPVLFVQGTKDSMCPLDKLEQVRAKLPVQNELYTVEGGDHSLKVGATVLKKSFMTLPEVEKKAANAIKTFLKKVLPSS